MSDVTIFSIEQHLFNKQYAATTDAIHAMFRDFRRGEHFSSVVDTNRIAPEIIAIYTRLARCLSKLFLNYTVYKIDHSLFMSWLVYAREIRAIFTISGFYRTDFLMGIFDLQFKEALNEQATGKDRLVDIEQLAYRLLLFSMLENNTHVDFTIFFKFFPVITMATLFSLLSSLVIVTPQGAAKREQLFDLAPLIASYEVPHTAGLLDVYVVWMICSYASRRDKHIVKLHLNNSTRRWLTQEQMLPRTSCKIYDPTLKKPTMLVVLEFFRSWHSMGRSYGLALQSLRDKFHLVGLVLQTIEAEDKNYALFDEVLNFECCDPGNITINTEKLRAEIEKVAALQPDLIYYPSLGMHQSAIILANIRLAPIQMMSFGHPASSFCETLDYGLIEADYAPESEDLFSEKMILLPPESFVSQPIDYLRQFVPSHKQNQEILHIAISAILPKVSAAFLQACKQIALQSKRRIAFLFFMNETEITYLQCKKDILDIVPEAQIIHRLTFEEYLQHLDTCDLYLSTFPFGGANSVIDAMCVGLPVVCLRGEDISGRTDSALISRRGLPKWLVAHTEEEYISAALRLIHNDEERLHLNAMILAESKNLFPENNPNHQLRSHDFSTACWHIYQKHSLLQKIAKNTLLFEELESLSK